MDEKVMAGCGFLLPAVLEITNISMVYYSRDGEPVLCLGDGVPDAYMRLPEKVADELRRTGRPWRQAHDGADGPRTIACGPVRDSCGNVQGYVLTHQVSGSAPNGSAAGRIIITADTGLAELLAAYPALYDGIGQINEELSELNDPMALEMLRRVTIGELAKSLGTDLGGLISKIEELISRYVGEETTRKK